MPEKHPPNEPQDGTSENSPSRLVTLFSHIRQVTGGEDMLLESVIEMIRAPTYKKECEDVQATHQQGGKPAANEIKVARLPYYTPTGTCTHRSIEGFDQSSRICHGDIDISNISARNKAAEIARIRERLINDRYTVFVHSSPSGGIKFGFDIPPVATNEEYKRYWRALEHYMKREYGVVIDDACKDISRACFLAYDPQAYYNEHAETFTQTRDEPAAKARAAGTLTQTTTTMWLLIATFCLMMSC